VRTGPVDVQPYRPATPVAGLCRPAQGLNILLECSLLPPIQHGDQDSSS
jgi:hypothetical protein